MKWRSARCVISADASRVASRWHRNHPAQQGLPPTCIAQSENQTQARPMPRGTLAHGIVTLILAAACTWHGPPKADVEPRAATPVVVLAATGPVSKTQAQIALDEATATAASRKRAEELVTAVQAQTEVPLVRGNHARLLIDGPQTYKAMFAAVEKAHDHIHIETYIFADDEVGRRFAD